MAAKRRYESNAKRSLPEAAARPAAVSSLRPRFKIVFIMPGIEARAPERTETRSGFDGSPNFLPSNFSILATAVLTSASRSFGNLPPALLNSVQTSVVMVNPGGTGTPMLVISARFAPLPPSRFFMSLFPSALPPPKKYTRLMRFPAAWGLALDLVALEARALVGFMALLPVFFLVGIGGGFYQGATGIESPVDARRTCEFGCFCESGQSAGDGGGKLGRLEPLLLHAVPVSNGDGLVF